MNKEDWIKEGIQRAREGSMYIARAHHMSHSEALAYADKCEARYLEGIEKTRG